MFAGPCNSGFATAVDFFTEKDQLLFDPGKILVHLKKIEGCDPRPCLFRLNSHFNAAPKATRQPRPLIIWSQAMSDVSVGQICSCKTAVNCEVAVLKRKHLNFDFYYILGLFINNVDARECFFTSNANEHTSSAIMKQA